LDALKYCLAGIISESGRIQSYWKRVPLLIGARYAPGIPFRKRCTTLVPARSYRYSTFMFDVLVYLYETYYRPDACPSPAALVKKLSAIGFEDDEITSALDWLTDLAKTTTTLAGQYPQQGTFSFGIRIYVQQEMDALGTAAVGFIQFLEAAKLLNPVQREIVIERALAVSGSLISLDKLKVIVLMVLWSQGKEPDGLMFDELFLDDDEPEPRQLH
jgi:Smg protein